MIIFTKTKDLKVLASTVVKDGNPITGGIHFKKHPLGGILAMVTDGYTLISLYDEDGTWEDETSEFMLEGDKKSLEHLLPLGNNFTAFTPGQHEFNVIVGAFPYSAVIPRDGEKSNRFSKVAYLAASVITRFNEIAKKLNAGTPLLHINNRLTVEALFTLRKDVYMIAMPAVQKERPYFERPNFMINL